MYKSLFFYIFAAPDEQVNVWKKEEKVNKIGHFPDKSKRHNASGKNHNEVKSLVKTLIFSLKQIVKSLLAKVTPANSGGKSKTDNGNG